MATKKQILFPIGILVLGVGIAAGFSAMKKPPEEKDEKEIFPLVQIQPAAIQSITLDVSSYGLIAPKNQTKLVAQLSGQLVNVSETFVVGGFVKKGDVLARIDPNDYEAALIEAQATLAQARSALEVERAQGHVAQSEWERIRKNSNEFIPSELYLRKPQLAEQLARFKASEASLKRAKRNLERTYISAPYDAIIAKRDVSLGSVVSPGSNIGELNSISIAEVRLPVADKDMQYLIKGGINANVVLTTQYAGKQYDWQANIVRSEGVINQKSRMSYLVAQVKNPYAQNTDFPPLRFGAYVNAKIQGLKINNTATVARHLVKNNKIAVLTTDNTLTYQTVDILREFDDKIVLSNGLQNGDKIITTALDYPSEGMKLTTEHAKPSQLDSDEKNETQIAMKKD
ncbi:efflux RND transporter periplasmic adaptor subunit [Pseudoalteromonas denitrificans]|uniref:RND family efflux transporter, MFP subunit n=1 Tax=Pseudoalteromonas denitrificans DSM 6059 TaxID=1123010 RepID=A0A1I1N9G8_9GAMM|nr:efflux RND transporter periplasmic adaptor subunit [Pseudoalteromonas denitrificans]SFC94311.1 RND family efflux transporter, MFP subunit [Pseudoalteromonas denitrificans DSM 6059]